MLYLFMVYISSKKSLNNSNCDRSSCHLPVSALERLIKAPYLIAGMFSVGVCEMSDSFYHGSTFSCDSCLVIFLIGEPKQHMGWEYRNQIVLCLQSEKVV